MKVLKQLASLALFPVLGEGGRSLVDVVSDRFGDASQRVPRALQEANERAWRALEISLTGPSLWQRCKQKLSAGEEKAFREQVQSFLQSVVLPEVLSRDTDFRDSCLRELRAARKAQLIPGSPLEVNEVTEVAAGLSRYDDPSRLLKEELRALEALAEDLSQSGYVRLARFVTLSPPSGRPLLLVAVRYFFRREVETDPKLAAGLTFQQLEDLSEAQEAGFRGLQETLDRHGEVVTNLLEDIHEVVTETRDEVRELKEEMQRLSQYVRESRQAAAVSAPAPEPPSREGQEELQRQYQQLQEMYRTAVQMMQQMSPGANPPGSASPAAPSPLPAATTEPAAPAADLGWGQVRQLVARYRSMPKERQREMPLLSQAISRLELAADQTAPNVADAEAGSGTRPLPAVPSSAPAPAGGEPHLRRIRGKPVSNLFAAPHASEEPQPAADAPIAPKPAGRSARPVSSLFSSNPKTTAEADAARKKPEEPSKKPDAGAG